ncbi:hypothetical protein ACFL23_03060 [Patescibacteria group bacterium]
MNLGFLSADCFLVLITIFYYDNIYKYYWTNLQVAKIINEENPYFDFNIKKEELVPWRIDKIFNALNLLSFIGLFSIRVSLVFVNKKVPLLLFAVIDVVPVIMVWGLQSYRFLIKRTAIINKYKDEYPCIKDDFVLKKLTP